MTMLTLILKMRPTPGVAGLSLLARELALDVADATYCPDASQHVPGIANKGADALSRKHAPPKAEGDVWALPDHLRADAEITVPLRDRSCALHFVGRGLRKVPVLRLGDQPPQREESPRRF